ncbi:MAG: transcription initiation factor IIB family protein [Halobacteriaceae archaeon]
MSDANSARARTEETCPECSGPLANQGDEVICGGCGLVVSTDRIDRGPEWRSFDDGEDGTNPERTGAPLTRSRHDRGLSTEIGRDNRLKGRKRRRLARMRRQHDRAQIRSKAERNKVYGFTEIRRLVGALSLPKDVREQACVLFETAQDAGLFQGRSLEGFASASVYAVCRVRAIARTVGEIVEHARGDAAELRAAYDAMNRELGLQTGPIDPAQYVPRYASELDVPDRVQRRGRELVARAQDAGIIGGRNPSGVAAACLYTAAREHDVPLTQAEAAEAADVTPVTLRGTFYDLQELND